jgi:hypothetical protein
LIFAKLQRRSGARSAASKFSHRVPDIRRAIDRLPFAYQPMRRPDSFATATRVTTGKYVLNTSVPGSACHHGGPVTSKTAA